MLDKSALSTAIDSILLDEARVTAALVPGISELAKGERPPTNQTLLRLRIEAVRRVWATADTHTLAQLALLAEDYDAAREWIAYVEVAMRRDKRLLTDLAIDESQVRATAPLCSTVALIETMLRNIYAYGSIPALAYAVLIEWNHAHSIEFAAVLESNTRFGSGSRVAQREDYASKLIEIAHPVVARHPGGLPLFTMLLRESSAFIRATLAEVYALTTPVAASPQQPSPQPESPSGS